MIQKLVRARSAGDLGTPMLEQLIVRRLLEDFDGVLAHRRDQLRAGREHLVPALRARFPEWDVPSPDGGLTLWVGLGSPVSSQLTLASRQRGLLLAAGPRFGLDGAFERFLRIPFSIPIEELDIAVDALSGAWADLSGAPIASSDYFADVI
jgi:DNA-binding transcriptional MocR family regulator